MGVTRNLFGPSKEEIWHQLSTEIQANYVDGGFLKGDKVQATHGPWTVTLDTYVVSTGKAVIPFTRMRAPYLNQDGFRFTIYREGMFSGVAKALGMQDVEIGHESFDRDFIIKGNDGYKLRQLFASQKLRDLITHQPDINLSVEDDEGWFGQKFPNGVDELKFHVGGFIKDLDRLKQLYELFAEVLDQLSRMGSAGPGDPQVQL